MRSGNGTAARGCGRPAQNGRSTETGDCQLKKISVTITKVTPRIATEYIM